MAPRNRIPIGIHPHLMALFRRVRSCDYTKICKRMFSDRLRVSYHLTVSLTEKNLAPAGRGPERGGSERRQAKDLPRPPGRAR